MQNGIIPAQLTPHERPYFVPTSKILIPPSTSDKTHRRLVRRLIGRQVCQLGGRVESLNLQLGFPRQWWWWRRWWWWWWWERGVSHPRFTDWTKTIFPRRQFLLVPLCFVLLMSHASSFL